MPLGRDTLHYNTVHFTQGGSALGLVQRRCSLETPAQQPQQLQYQWEGRNNAIVTSTTPAEAATKSRGSRHIPNFDPKTSSSYAAHCQWQVVTGGCDNGASGSASPQAGPLPGPTHPTGALGGRLEPHPPALPRAPRATWVTWMCPAHARDKAQVTCARGGADA